MNEAARYSETDPVDFQDIHDAVMLGFWGIELQPCSIDNLPFSYEEAKEVHNLRQREVCGYDAGQGCLVEVTQFRCSREEGGVLIPEDIVLLRWENGSTIMLDLIECNIGYMAQVDSVSTLSEATLKRQAKSGLAAVESIFD